MRQPLRMLDLETTANNYKKEAEVMGIIEEQRESEQEGWPLAADAEARVARVAGCDGDNEEVRSSKARES